MGFVYHHLCIIDVTVLRYFMVYGPAGQSDIVKFRFYQWIAEGKPIVVYGDGEQSSGFTYLNDIALGIIQALKSLGFAINNLGGHELITIIT